MFKILAICLFVLFSAVCEGLTLSELSYLGQFKKGETRCVKITLTNDSNCLEKIELKQCDYFCNYEGQHFFEEIGSNARSNASWISLSTKRVILKPREKTNVYLTVKVPQNPSLAGSYWSVILVEPEDPIQPSSQAPEGLALNVKIRYAYHIVTNVEHGTPKLKIIHKEFKTIDGQDLLCIDVANTGNLFLNPKLILKLYTNQGLLEKTLETQTERLYPGNSQRYFLSIHGPLSKKYTAFLLLDNGDNHIFGDSFDLECP